MNHGLSDQVRAVALEKYVHPAILAGKAQFSVAVKDLMQHLRAEGFPGKNWPQVCTALQAEKFLRTNGLEIEGVDGPPSKMSTTVIVHYRLSPADAPRKRISSESSISPTAAPEETPEEWAHRMSGKLFGLMKDEFAAFGGGEAFLRWVRSEDEDPTA